MLSLVVLTGPESPLLHDASRKAPEHKHRLQPPRVSNYQISVFSDSTPPARPQGPPPAARPSSGHSWRDRLPENAGILSSAQWPLGIENLP